MGRRRMCEPVGVADIADRLGRKRQTVALWKLNDLLPPPRWFVSGHPAWDWPQIRKWAKATGRL